MPPEVETLFSLVRGLDNKIQTLTTELRKENDAKIAALNYSQNEALKDCQKDRCDPRHSELKGDVKSMQRTMWLACGGAIAASYIFQLILQSV